jgi:hypothetical protein
MSASSEANLRKKSWLRPQFTLAALLLFFTISAPFLAYLAEVRKWNDRRRSAYRATVSKGMTLQPAIGPPPVAAEETAARKLWTKLSGDPKLPQFGRLHIHDYFGKDRPRPPVSDEDLAQLKYLTEISQFDFYHSRTVTDQGLAVVCELPHLTALSLSDLHGVTGEFLEHLPEDSPLESITLSQMEHLDGKNLAPLARLKHLRSLRIENCPSIRADAIREMNLPPSLKDLALAGMEMPEETLGRWMDQVRLERLYLSVPVTEGFAPALAKQTELVRIEIYGARLRDEHFAFLDRCAALQSIKLGGMPLRGRFLKGLHRKQLLTDVHLSNTIVDDEAIAELSTFPSLHILNLAWTPITGEGFAVKEGWPVLSTLYLPGVQLSEAGKDALTTIPRLNSIQLPGNWAPEDLSRFPGGSKIRSVGSAAYSWPPGMETYAPTLSMMPIDANAPEEMAPVRRLQEIGWAAQKEYEERQKLADVP